MSSTLFTAQLAFIVNATYTNVKPCSCGILITCSSDPLLSLQSVTIALQYREKI